MIAQYDGDVAYGDQEFGRFVRELKTRGLYDRALIVFLADHGEEFQDHGQWLHGRSLFDELIRIPLIVKFPGQKDAGRRVPQQVQGVDVLPTFLAAMGLAGSRSARDRGTAVAGDAGREARQSARRSRRSAIGASSPTASRTEGDKFIRRFNPEQDELYFDLTKDPKERASVLADAPERVRRLRARAEEAMTAQSLPPRSPPRGRRRLCRHPADRRLDRTGASDRARPGRAVRGRRERPPPRPPGAPPAGPAARGGVRDARPWACPVWLEGTRAGRPLREGDVTPGRWPDRRCGPLPAARGRYGQRGRSTRRPASSSRRRATRPASRSGWSCRPAGKLVELDRETRERLKALGYLGQ